MFVGSDEQEEILRTEEVSLIFLSNTYVYCYNDSLIHTACICSSKLQCRIFVKCLKCVIYCTKISILEHGFVIRFLFSLFKYQRSILFVTIFLKQAG